MAILTPRQKALQKAKEKIKEQSNFYSEKEVDWQVIKDEDDEIVLKITYMGEDIGEASYNKQTNTATYKNN